MQIYRPVSDSLATNIYSSTRWQKLPCDYFGRWHIAALLVGREDRLTDLSAKQSSATLQAAVKLLTL